MPTSGADTVLAELPPQLGPAVQALARAFAAAGLDTPGLDARRLAEGVLQVTATDILARGDTTLAPDERRRLTVAARRRLLREPVSRILGLRRFWGRDFEVAPATLDPRPETETLVETALRLIEHNGRRSGPLRLLDIGTGTGAILLTLLAELPAATGVGTDVDDGALAVAARNARRIGAASRAEFLSRRSLCDVAGPFDLVVANLPYIASAAIDELEPEVRDHDPRLALDGGPDGLDIYREVVPGLVSVAPDAAVLLEIGHDQAAAVTALAAEQQDASWHVGVQRDLAGRQRAVIFLPQGWRPIRFDLEPGRRSYNVFVD